MSALLLAALISDPQMTQVLLEGRDKETRIEMAFRGHPTFQSFRSHQPNILVVDVVGAGLPAGFPSQVDVINGVKLHFSEHHGSRTQLMRIRLTLPPRMEPQLTTGERVINLTLPRGSTVAKAVGPSGAKPKLAEALATRLQKRLRSLSKEHHTVSEQLTQKEEEIERLSRRLSDALANVNRLDQSIREKDRTVASAQKARRQAEDKAQAALRAVQATERQARREVSNLARKQAVQEQGSAQSLTELEARRGEIDRLLRQQEKIKSKLAALARVTVKQARESKRLVQTEVGLRADVESSLKSLGESRGKLGRINARVDQGEQSVAQLSKERKQVARQVKRTQKRIAGRVKDLDSVASQQTGLRKSLALVGSQLAKHQKRQAELDSQYVAARDDNATARKRLEALRRDRKALKKALGGIRGELAQSKKKHRAQQAGQQKIAVEASALKKAIAQASSEQGKLAGQVAKMGQETQKKQHQLVSLRKQLAPLTAQHDKLRLALVAETKRGAAADAQVAKASATLAMAKTALKTQEEKLVRMRRQRLAQVRRAAKMAAKQKTLKLAATKAARRAKRPQAKVAKPILVAEAKPQGAKASVSDAQATAGFGGGPRVQTGRFERIGYRPVGPERVLVRYGGNSEPVLSKLSATRTLIRLPGVSAATKRLRPLDTSLFGGVVQSIRPRKTRRGLRLELRHEKGVEFHIVRTVSGVELRVR